VRSGTARVVIAATGARTAFGQIAARLNAAPAETDFQRGVRQFGYLLTQVMLVLTLIVFASNVFASKPPLEALLFAIALAVGISPELLPAIISITLSKGAQRMARQGVIVRRLESIENLGSMDTLCTDKTGTLTEGVVRLDSALDPQGRPCAGVLRDAYLNACLQAGLSNPLDDALKAVTPPPDVGEVTKVDEIPYDFSRRRLSVIVRDARVETMITKGAFESVLDVCDTVDIGGTAMPLDDSLRAQLEQCFDDWGDQGFRVLGLATRQLNGERNGDGKTSYEPSDEAALVFRGFLLFFDPPKAGAGKTVSDLEALGVQLKVITGDNHHVARHLSNAVGITPAVVLTGREMAAMGDEALRALCDRINVFAEVDPNQKERIIAALQKSGHVVGYLGDGINDAPALRAADVGVSVDTAVDVAKDAADLVLLRQDMDVLRQGIEQGRVTFANTLKYIFTTTSANFGNMFSMAGASLFLPFLPLTASQILLNNFLSDFPALAIANDNVDPEWIEAPRRWNIHFIRSFMIVFGLISSVFDYLTFGMLLFVMQSSPAQFRTGWFIESLLTELVIALVVRTRRPFYRSVPGRWLWLSTAIVSLVALTIPYLPVVSQVFGFVPLPPAVIGVLIAITALYVAAVELTKRSFFRRSTLPPSS
jgi:Mg2+-importing ATPase